MKTTARPAVRTLSPETRAFAEGTGRAWFAAGLLLCAFVPAARDVQPLLGWLPFWLLLAPLLVLAQLDALEGFARMRRLGNALRRRARPLVRHRGQARRVAPAAAARLSR